MNTMMRAGIVLSAATAAFLSMQPQAEARWRGAWPFAAGAVAGAVVGSVATRGVYGSPYYYGYGAPAYNAYGYDYAPAYTYAPRYPYGAPYYGRNVYGYPQCNYVTSRNFEVWDREHYGC